MQFGLFGSAQVKRGGLNDDSGAGFREFVERNVAAEALGYHSTFLVEHHFTGFGQVSPRYASGGNDEVPVMRLALDDRGIRDENLLDEITWRH